MTSVGDYLKKEREARNLDIRDVAELTKISERYLSCIECGDYDQLPPGPYAKGYIAAYARQVCGDETQALALYAGSCEARRQTEVAIQTDLESPATSKQSASEQDTGPLMRSPKLVSKLAGGLALVSAWRSVLPDGGNLKYLSKQGAAKKSALTTHFKAFFGILAGKLKDLPKGMMLKGLLVTGGLLMSAAVLILAGFGAYHLFIFKGVVSQAPQGAVSVSIDPPPEAAVRSDAAKAAVLAAANSPRINLSDSSGSEKKPAAKAPDPAAGPTPQPEEAISAPGSTPAAPAGSGASDKSATEEVAQKKRAADLIPKPADPKVAVQKPIPNLLTEAPDGAAPAMDRATQLPVMLRMASVCTAIEERMPVGVGERFPWTTPKIFVWSLLSASGPPAKVHHIYHHAGRVVSDVTLKVGSSHWRTWSFHSLSGQLHIGPWYVDITTEDGLVMRRLHFVIE
jgi:hypothetical protein